MKLNLRRFRSRSAFPSARRAATLILLGSISSLSAANLIWDSDGVSGGFVGGTGIWDTSSPYWDNGGVMQAWSNAAGDTAVFGGSSGFVTLNEPITAGGLLVTVPDYTLSGSTLTLANNAAVNLNTPANNNTTISSTIAGTNWSLNSLSVAPSLDNAAQGRLNIAAATTYTGILTINNGVLSVNDGANVVSGSGIVVNGSGLYHPDAFTGIHPYHRLRDGMLIVNGTTNQIGSQMVTLNGGTVMRVSNVGGSDTGTIQNITLNSGFNTLASAPQGGATGDTFAVTNLTRNGNATVEFRSTYGTLGANGDNGKISVTNLNGAPIANVNGIIGGWAYTNTAAANAQGNGPGDSFATWNAANASLMAAMPNKASGAAGGTLVNQLLSTALPTDNWLANNPVPNNIITSNLTINSLVEEGDVVVNSGALLTLASGGYIMRTSNFWIQSADATGQMTSGEANGRLYVNTAATIDALADFRIRVRIIDNGGTPVQLIKTGNGSTQIGDYNNAASTGNSFTGGTVIQEGRLQTAATDAFGFGPVTVLPGGQAYLFYSGTYANNFTLAGYGAPENAGVLGAIRFANGVVIGGNVTLSKDTRLNVFNAADTGQIAGGISGSGGLEKAGAGTLILTGSNTYAGPTNLTNGVLVIGDGSGTGSLNVGSVNLATGTTLKINTTGTVTIAGALSGGGTLSQIAAATTVLGGAVSLTNPITVNAGSLQVNGAISAPVTVNTNAVLKLNGSASGAISVNAGGKVSFGPAATFTGSPTLAEGAVIDQSANSYTFGSGKTIAIGRTGTPVEDVIGNVTFASNSTLNVGGTGVAKTATFAGDLKLDHATVQFDLSNVNTTGSGVNDFVNVLGTLDLSGGGISLGIGLTNGSYASGSYVLFTANTLIGNAASFAIGAPVPNARQTLAIDTTTVPNSVLLQATGSPAKSLTWTGATSSIWDVNTTTNWTDGAISEKFFNLDNTTFNDTVSHSSAIVLSGDLQPAVVTVNTTGTYTFTGTGRLTGGAVLTKQGSGTLVLTNTGVSDNIGVTTISAGTIQVGAGATDGNIGAGPIANNGTLVFNRSGTLAVPGAISGGGVINLIGDGETILSGNSSFTGVINVNAGTLNVSSVSNAGANSALGAAPSAAANLVINGAVLKYTGPAGTTDRLFTMGAGPTGGTLEASGTGAVNFTNPGAIAFTGTGNRTLTLTGVNTGSNTLAGSLANDASGTTTLHKVGAGTWVLNGTNTFTGGVIVDEGVLAVDGNQSTDRLLPGGAVTVNNTGIFEIRGTNALSTVTPQAFTINEGGTLRAVTGGSAVIGAGGASHAHVGNISLSAATINLAYSGAGTAFDNESFLLDGDITVTGLAPSSVTTTLNATLQGIALNGVRTITVADVTGSPGVDFSVNGEFENSSAGAPGLLTKAGNGTLALNFTNTHTGGTNVNAGVIQLGANGALGTGPTVVAAGAQIDLNGFATTTSMTIAGAGPDGNGALYDSSTNAAGITGITTLTLAGNATIGGAGQRWDIGTGGAPVFLNGGTFSLTKVGPNAIWYRGTSASTLGDVIVNGGVFGVETNSNVLGNTGRAYVNFGGTLSIWGTGTVATSQNKPITLNGGTLDNDWGGTGNSAWTGDIQVPVDSFLQNDTASELYVTGPISGAGGLTVTTTTTSAIQLSGNNTYAGTTYVNGAYLRAASSGAFSPASAYNLAAGAVRLRLNGFSNTVGSLTGFGNVDNTSPAPATLSVGADNTSTFFDGLLQDGTGGGPLGLTKVGTGQLVLSAAQTYTGATAINGGILLVTGSLSGSGVTINSGGTLAGIGFIQTNVTANAGSTISPGDGYGTLTITGSLNLTNAVAGTATHALAFQLDSPGASDLVLLSTAGLALTLGNGALNFDDFNFTAGPNFNQGQYVLIDSQAAIAGTLGSNPSGFIGVLPGTLGISGDGTDLILTVLPEPGSALLLLGGLGLLAGRRRRN